MPETDEDEEDDEDDEPPLVAALRAVPYKGTLPGPDWAKVQPDEDDPDCEMTCKQFHQLVHNLYGKGSLRNK